MKRAVFICFLMVGCKSGEGERCQVNDDCRDPLVCNIAKNTCQDPGVSAVFDAEVPDGPPADAAVDAPPDAP